MRIGIFGRGRLGQAIAAEAANVTDLELLWHIDKGQTPTAPVEVAIDASVAGAVPEHLDWALAQGCDLVIAQMRGARMFRRLSGHTISIAKAVHLIGKIGGMLPRKTRHGVVATSVVAMALCASFNAIRAWLAIESCS